MTATVEAARAAILALVTRSRGTSFVDVEHELDRLGYPYVGDYDVALPGNVVIWAGWTQDAAELVNDLLRARRVHLNATSPLTYVIDGKLLNLPIAKRPPARGYKTARWAPCTLEAGPALESEP